MRGQLPRRLLNIAGGICKIDLFNRFSAALHKWCSPRTRGQGGRPRPGAGAKGIGATPKEP